MILIGGGVLAWTRRQDAKNRPSGQDSDGLGLPPLGYGGELGI